MIRKPRHLRYHMVLQLSLTTDIQRGRHGEFAFGLNGFTTSHKIGLLSRILPDCHWKLPVSNYHTLRTLRR